MGADDVGQRATVDDIVRAVLESTPVIDGHNDLPGALRRKAGYSVEGLDRVREEFHTDLVRLRAGGVGAQFWSVYVSSSLPEPEATVATLEQIDAVYRMASRYPDKLRMAYTADDIEASFSTRRIASLLGVEGGHSIANSLGVLRSLARLGIRYMTLTHNENTEWADSATDRVRSGGLTDEGLAIVAEMNRLGVLVDISHTASSTQRDALRTSKAPVIFSHSSTRALSDHPRNVDDEVLGLLSQADGVVQITFVPPFVSDAVAAWRREADEARERAGLPVHEWSWSRAPRPGESPERLVESLGIRRTPGPPEPRDNEEYRAWVAAHPCPEVTISEVADHVEHAREVAGVDHVGIGGDYDGIDALPKGLEDVSTYPRLLGELARRGWNRSELEKLTGRNVLRVLRAAEDVATEPLWPTLQPDRSSGRLR